MKPDILVSTTDLDRLEGLLAMPPTRSRGDLDDLRDELERATVVEPDVMPADVVVMNSRARFREETSGREYELTLVWPHEADGSGERISIFSPAGSALLGLAVGQQIDWRTPEGHPIRLTVLAVWPAG